MTSLPERDREPVVTSGLRGPAKYCAELLAIGAAYFLLAKAGLLLASIHPSATPVWPAAGLALAAILLRGVRVWPAIFAGSLTAKLFASTSGTDSDFIVRLIDVYPETYAKDPSMSGYQLLISGEPVRARFRKSFEKPEPVKANEVNEYTIDLHWSHHCFRKGHKIMVQVQSSWFPLIDRNPQKYVPNIFEARDADFQSAEQRVYRAGEKASHVSMQVMK